MHAGLKRFFADEIIELLQHARRLVVHDRAVRTLGLVEIRELLPERRRAGGLIDAVRRRLVALIEGFPRVARGLEIRHRLRRHVRRESFLQPEVVEPAHGDEIAEPLMRDFVQDRREPSEAARERGPFAENETVFVEHHDARMLHSAERKCGREHEVEFFERIRPAEVLLHPADRAMRQREQRVGVSFFRARFSDVHADRASLHH